LAFATSAAPPAAFAAKKAVEVVEVAETVDNTKKLIGIGAGAIAAAFAGFKVLNGGSSETATKQDFLEAEPYWDQSTVPVNVYKNKAPFT